MRRKQRKDYALPGSSRAARIRAEDAARQRLPARLHRALIVRATRRLNPVGLKRWFVPSTLDAVKTPYARKERLRRRAANRVAKASRKANRCPRS